MENKNISKVKRGEIYLYDFGTNEGSFPTTGHCKGAIILLCLCIFRNYAIFQQVL